MKVLEKGNPNGWEIEQYCTGKGNGDGGCGAKLLVAEADIYLTKRCWRDEVEHCYTFKCPECGCETDIPKDKIPARITGKLLNADKK